MKRFLSFKTLLLLGGITAVSMVSADSCPTGDCPTVKCYSRRSDSRHKNRIMAGQVGYTDRYDAESWYGLFSITPGYSGTFKGEKIAKCLFGNDIDCEDCPTIKVEGSAVTNRDPKAWLADYFYLPRNYKGSFTLDPKIKTFHLDIDGYLGFDCWCKGLYGRIYGTVVRTKWDLNFCDNPGFENDGTPRDHEEGYFTPREYTGTNLVQSFCEYAQGGIPTPEDGAALDLPHTGAGTDERALNRTVTFNPLNFARISKCDHTETGFADLRVELGWNFLMCEDYHLGLRLEFAAPTGSRKAPCFLFDAQVGNGDHWELGGGLGGHYSCWCSEDGESNFGFWFDLSVTHLFDKCQRRTFDLKNKPNSAYMLAAKFGANTTSNPPNDRIGFNATQDGTPDDSLPRAAADVSDPNPNRQFASEYAPVANLSTVRVDVSASVQADLVAMVNYRCGCFSWDLGYNFWARSCEDIDCPKSCNDGSICDSSQENTWALKGDARMFGYAIVEEPGANDETIYSIPLSATQSGADIHRGLNRIAPAQIEVTGATATDTNPNVDSAAFAYNNRIGSTAPNAGAPLAFSTDANTDPVNVGDPESLEDPQDHIRTSSVPVFLSCNSLDLARTRGLSHKIFTHLGWHWDQMEDCCWAPYVGVGASAEFGSNDDCCDNSTTTTSTTTQCKSCVDCAVSQWSVWVKGGLAFN